MASALPSYYGRTSEGQMQLSRVYDILGLDLWSVAARSSYLEKGTDFCVLTDSHDIKHAPIFNADPIAGLGTFPDASTNFELSNGAFHDIIREYTTTNHIQRTYTLRVHFAMSLYSPIIILTLEK